jgi:NAD(P)H dehydrogenase (quinone)
MKNENLYAITGITGQVGSSVARTLLDANQPIRAVVRDADKGATWARRGCEVAVAEINDGGSLTAAFKGAQGVFVLLPSNFDPKPGFPEVRTIIAAVRSALEAARPSKVVCLSTIGAQAAETNLLTQLSLVEQDFATLPMPITFLRPGWYMENCSSDVNPARETGLIQSFLQPIDKPVPMVATADVGRVAAELLHETWSGRRILELEGPHRVTPNEIAFTFSKILGRPVRAEAVPRESWATLFHSQGMKNPIPRIRMLDGFNEGWIEFEKGEAGTQKGKVSLETVLQALVERT